MASERTEVRRYRFDCEMAPPAAGSGVGSPWVKADTSAAGSPTVAVANGGLMVLTLDNTNEVQNLCLYFGDKLAFDIDDIQQADFWVKVDGTLSSGISAAWGLASARNDLGEARQAWANLSALMQHRRGKPAAVPSPPLPPAEPVETKEVAAPPEPAKVVADDLTVIRGIGPSMQQRLNAAGIHTFEQLAKSTPEVLRESLGDAGRLAKVEEWIAQAQGMSGPA